MKLAFLSEYEYGPGAAVAAHRLARRMAETGDEILFLHLFPPHTHETPTFRLKQVGAGRGAAALSAYRTAFGAYQEIARRETEAEESGAAASRAFWGALAGLGRFACLRACYRANAREVVAALEEFRPDGVHVHSVPSFLGHGDIARISRRWPTVWTMHDGHPLRLRAHDFHTPDGRRRTIPRALMAESRRAPDMLLGAAGRFALASPSAWMARETANVVAGRQPVEVIPYGVSRRDFFPLEKSLAREKLDLPRIGRLRLLAVASSRENERKNIGMLLEAMRLVPPQDAELLLLGAAEASAPNVVPLKSRYTAEELRVVYSAADAFAVPSLADNLPATAIESLFCGTPVLGSNRGGIPEIAVAGRTGWLFDPAAPADLAARIREIAARPDEVQRLAANCRAFAQENFGEDQQVFRYRQLFRALAGGGQTPAAGNRSGPA